MVVCQLLVLTCLLREGLASTSAEGVIVAALPVTSMTNTQVVHAIKMAADEFNNEIANSGWKLRVHHVHAPEEGFSEFEKTLDSLRDPSTVAVMGLSSASAVQTVSAVAKHLHLPVITTSTSKRSAWSESLFPTLLYSRPSDAQLPYMIKDLIQYFSWRKVCVITSNDFSAFSAIEAFVTKVAPAYNVVVTGTVSAAFERDGNMSADTSERLAKKGEKCNVFVVGVDAKNLPTVMKAANRFKLVKTGTAWVFVDMASGPKLLSSELKGYMEGSLVLRHNTGAGNNSELRFAEKLHRFNQSACPCPSLECVSLEAMYAYDATRGLAQAMQKWARSRISRRNTVSLTNSVSLPALANGNALLNHLKAVNFSGVAGQFRFAKVDDKAGFDIFNVRNRKLVRVGQWRVAQAIPHIDNVIWTGGSPEIPEARFPTNSSHINVLVPISAPFTYLLRTPPQSNEDFAGVAVDILANVSKLAGFNYTLIHWTRTWDEMVIAAGDPDNEYDLAIGSITVKKDRALVANYTRSVYLTGLRMLVRRPETKQNGYWEFLKPFDWTVWLVLALTLVMSAGVMTVLDREGVDTVRTGHTYFDSLFFTTNVFFFVHEADVITQLWARVFLTVLQFVTLTLLAAYTANMATFLSNQQVEPIVSTYTDVSRYPVASRGGTTNWVFAQEQLGLRNLVNVTGADDVVGVLRSGQATAYIADIPHIEKIASEHCDLVVIGNRVSEA